MFLWCGAKTVMGIPGGSNGKEFAWNAGDPGSIPVLGRSPGEGNDYSLQCSCLDNSVDRELDWWATDMGSQTVRHNWVASTFTFFHSKTVTGWQGSTDSFTVFTRHYTFGFPFIPAFTKLS